MRPTGTELTGYIGTCRAIRYLEELHNKDEYGGESDTHVYYANHACHRPLFPLYGIELQTQN